LHWAATYAKKDILAAVSLFSQSSFTVLAVIVLDALTQLLKNMDDIHNFPSPQAKLQLSLSKSIP